MATEKPSIVIVQGSFQAPLVYNSLLTRLRELGYSVHLPPFASCSDVDNDDFPTRTLMNDVSAVARIIENLIKEEKTVVVVMHSYGGIVGSYSFSESLSYKARQARGQKGGVKSVLETFGESPNNDVKDDGRFYIKNGASTLYSDLPAVEATWESPLIPQSYRVQKTSNEQAVPSPFQRMFAKMVNTGVDSCDTGHSPILSQTGMLVGKIATAVDKAAAAVYPSSPVDRLAEN
ncbi:hypothetical protein BDW69DRAFT_197900 [Aspergillus filifer]